LKGLAELLVMQTTAHGIVMMMMRRRRVGVRLKLWLDGRKERMRERMMLFYVLIMMMMM
jgi:hypothetical protein